MKKKLTLKEARETVKSLSPAFTIYKSYYGEYRLAFGKERYYTDDLKDVVDTAKMMWRHPMS